MGIFWFFLILFISFEISFLIFCRMWIHIFAAFWIHFNCWNSYEDLNKYGHRTDSKINFLMMFLSDLFDWYNDWLILGQSLNKLDKVNSSTENGFYLRFWRVRLQLSGSLSYNYCVLFLSSYILVCAIFFTIWLCFLNTFTLFIVTCIMHCIVFEFGRSINIFNFFVDVFSFWYTVTCLFTVLLLFVFLTGC